MTTVVTDPVTLGAGVPDATTIETDLKFLIIQTISSTLTFQEAPLALVSASILASALIAANNLSDLVDAVAARGNLGAKNLYYVSGTSAPSNSVGIVNDFAINDNGVLYEKTGSTTWTNRIDLATGAEVTAAIAAHTGASDPHPVYLTQTEGDGRYPLSSALPESIDDRVAALLQAGANITLTYNDAGNILTIASTASGGATGLKYTYNTTAGTGVISAADLTIATGLTINATDAQGKSASDVLARLKNGAIILVAKDESNWVRYAVTADYASGSVTVTVAQSLGAISSGNTVYLSIISDAPSSGGGALNQLSPGAITAAGGNSSIIVTQSIAASGGVAPYTYAWYKSATPNFVVDGSSLVSGATGTGYTETGLGLSETRYYRRVTTDGLANKVATVEISGVSNASVDTADGQPVIGSTAQNGQTIYKIQPSSPNGIYASGTATSASGTVDAGWDAGATSYTFTCPYAGNTNVSVWVRVGGVNSAQGYLLNMFSGGLAIYDATGSAFNVVTSSGALATSGTVVVTVTPTSVVFDANSGAFTYTITSTTYASNTGVGFSVGGSNSIPNFPTVT
jgi:hypothetical protein